MNRVTLKQLAVRQLYERPFDGLALNELDDHLTVVYGPNNSGKTTLALATARVFTAHRSNVIRSDRVGAHVHFDGSLTKVELNGPATDPNWPQSGRANLYRLDLTEIITGPGGDDQDQVREALAGGINLRDLEVAKPGKLPRRELEESARKLGDARRSADELQQKEERLLEQRRSLEEATKAQADLRIVQLWLDALGIEDEAENLGQQIAVLDENHGIERQGEKAAEEAETDIAAYQEARNEVLRKRGEMRSFNRARTRNSFAQCDGEALSRLEHEADGLNGQFLASQARKRDSELARQGALRELRQVREDAARAPGKLNDAVLEALIREVTDKQNAINDAGRDLAHCLETVTAATRAYEMAGGDPAEHPPKPCERDQVQRFLDLDREITSRSVSLQEAQTGAKQAKENAAAALAGFEVLSLPPRQVLDALLGEPSMPQLQDEVRRCQREQQVFSEAAASLRAQILSDEELRDLHLATEALSDWLKAIPDQRGTALPLWLPIAAVVGAVVVAVLGFFLDARIATGIAAVALAAIGIAVWVMRARKTLDDPRQSAATRIPQQWRPADWSVGSVAAQYGQIAFKISAVLSIQSLARDLDTKGQQVSAKDAQQRLLQKGQQLAQYVRLKSSGGYEMGYLVRQLSDVHSTQQVLAAAKRRESELSSQLRELQDERGILLSVLQAPVRTAVAVQQWANALESLLVAKSELHRRVTRRDIAQAEWDQAKKAFDRFCTNYTWPSDGDARVLGDELQAWFDVTARLEASESEVKSASEQLDAVEGRRAQNDAAIEDLFRRYGFSSPAATIDSIRPFRDWFEKCESWSSSVRQAARLRRNLRSRLDENGAPTGRLSLQRRVLILRQRQDAARQRRELAQRRDALRQQAHGKRRGQPWEDVFRRWGISEQPDRQELVDARDQLDARAQLAEPLRRDINTTEALINERGEQHLVSDAEAQRAKAVDRVQDWLVAKANEIAMQATLDQIKDLFQREAQPALIAKANDWLSRLTTGRFCEIDCSDKALRVRDGVDEDRRKTVHELSTGTRVHLAVAVRLAVIETSETAYRFPLFLDEVMATSDPEVSRAIAQAVKEISLDRQVVIFTNQPDDINVLQEVIGPAVKVVTLASARPPIVASPVAPPAETVDVYEPGLPITSPIRNWHPSLVREAFPELDAGVPTVFSALQRLAAAARAEVEPKLEVAETLRGQIARSCKRLTPGDLDGQEWITSTFRPAAIKILDEVSGRPQEFMGRFCELRGMRSDNKTKCREWLEENGYLLDLPLARDLRETALQMLGTDGASPTTVESIVGLFTGYMIP